MDIINTKLDKLLKEHDELQFSSFSPATAFQLGMKLKEEAEKQKLTITIDVTMNGHQLFHCALDGTSADNDRWVKRKNNLVNHFGKSSYYIKHLLMSNNETIDSMFFLDPMEYAPFGGSFPIIIKGTGPVGTITVSGLPDEEDHRLVTSVIRQFSS